MDTAELKSCLEGLVFASAAPVKAERLAEATGAELPAVRRALTELVAEYAEVRRGFLLQEVAGGFQFRTRPEYAEHLRRFARNRPSRFSRAALETLAIIAYRQPVTRGEIEYLRGVDSGAVLKTLLDKHLVRILGKKDIPGKPLLYGTSQAFLEMFGLRDLTGLPTLKEFTDLDADGEGLLGTLDPGPELPFTPESE